MFESGNRIKRRRKKRFITLNAVGFRKGLLARYQYDTEECSWGLNMTSLPDAPTAEQLLQGGEFTMIFPAEDYDRKKQLELRLMEKFFLGTGHWLWGEKFSRSTYAAILRKHLNEGTPEEEVLDLRPDEKHLVMKDEKGEEVDALDNAPHTTIGFFEEQGLFLGVVNLLGGYESLSSMGELDPSIDLGIKDGVVVIVKSTKNEVVRMNLDEYERFKDAEYRASKAKTDDPTQQRQRE